MWEKRSTARKSTIPKSFAMEQGLLPGRGVKGERLPSCAKQRSRASFGPSHTPGPGAVLGEKMVPLDGWMQPLSRVTA